METIRELITSRDFWFAVAQILLAISLLSHMIETRINQREFRLKQWLMANEIESMQKRIYFLESSDRKEPLTFVEKLYEKQ